MRIPERSVAPALCIATMAVLTACAPVVRTVFPDITGSITNGGAAVQDAEVSVGQGPGGPECSNSKRRVSVNASGEFSVDRHSELGVAHFGGEEFTDWHLCVRVGERIYPGIWFYGHSSKTFIQLQCDLQRKSKDPPGGICVVKD